MFAPTNNILHAENTDLSTGMTLVLSRVENVYNLRTEEKFCDVWDEFVTQIDAHSEQTRRDIRLLRYYVVEETTGNNEMNKDKIRRIFYTTLDKVINETDVRFSHQNTELYADVSALLPEKNNFLDVKMVQSLYDMIDCTFAQVWKQNLMLLRRRLLN